MDDASLSLRGQRSRVLGERLHWDGASVVHFIEGAADLAALPVCSGDAQ
jgi:hypothetical protein